MKDDIGFLIVSFLWFALAFSVGLWAGLLMERHHIRTEAVKAGVGEWIPNVEGHVRFEFKSDSAKNLPPE